MATATRLRSVPAMATVFRVPTPDFILYKDAFGQGCSHLRPAEIGGLMPRAFTESAPQVARRTSDVRERQEWERRNINPKNPDISPRQQTIIDAWDSHEAHWREIERRNAQQRADDAAALAAHHAAIRRHNELVVAQRQHELLLTEIFEQHGATDAERHKVRLLVERNHPAGSRTIELYKFTLLRLRGELQGTPDNQIDWRSCVKESRTK
jgi:hypothetical protein